MQRRSLLVLGASLAILPRWSEAAGARTLSMGLTTAPTSLDPHYHDSFTSTQALLQIYSQLRVQDATGAVRPGLATNCVALDDTTWELTLRQGVRFHDGTPFEAEDIPFSFDRVKRLTPALSSFQANVRDIEAVEILNPVTVRIRLKGPDPLFEYKLGQVCMLSRRLHADATTRDFTSGRLAIGTGAYKVKRYNVGDSLELERNDAFWGGMPDWDSVSIRYVSDAGARIAALRSGDVDLIDGVAVQEVAGLKQDSAFSVFTSPAFLTAYLTPDTARAQSPFITGNDGQPLPRNPLADARVRQALSLSLNRAAMVERLMLGQALLPDQFVGPAAADRAQGMPKLAFDVAEAKRLLEQAGYPDGFRLTIHGPAGYFNNDVAVLQAVAQGFTRIGIRTQVETMPNAMFVTRTANKDFSLYMNAFNGAFALIALRYLAMVPDRETGNGSSNRLDYNNPRLEAAMQEAIRTMDAGKRRALTDEASRLLMDDMGHIPLFYGVNSWAGRKARVRYEANPMGRTSAFMAKPAG
jgi:peptide/nickel transport system substrate-binding protein